MVLSALLEMVMAKWKRGFGTVGPSLCVEAPRSTQATNLSTKKTFSAATIAFYTYNY